MKNFFRIFVGLIIIGLAVCLANLGVAQPAKTVSAANQSSYKISITIPREYQNMGTYAVWIELDDGSLTKVPNTASNEYTFDSNTVIIIKALPKSFYKVKDFKQNFMTELVADDTLRVNVLSKREFVILFEKKVLDIPEDSVVKKISNGSLSVTYSGTDDKIALGSEIYISADLNSLYEVKDFIINGIAVNNSNYVGNVEYSDNSAIIRVTEDWLAGYGDNLEIEVTTQLKQTYLIAGLCAVVVLPLMLIFAVQMIIANNKTKKFATASLKGKQVMAQRMKTGDYISELREGKIKNVDKKSIKEEIKGQKVVIKEEKEKGKEHKEDSQKKAAPAAASAGTATAVKEVKEAATPALTKQQLIQIFDGGTIQTDRTVVDKNKNKIGVLQKNATIVDLKGAVFAYVDVAKGVITDKDKNEVGVVTGNGTIVKPGTK